MANLYSITRLTFSVVQLHKWKEDRVAAMLARSINHFMIWTYGPGWDSVHHETNFPLIGPDHGELGQGTVQLGTKQLVAVKNGS